MEKISKLIIGGDDYSVFESEQCVECPLGAISFEWIMKIPDFS